jgi:hypothetical protein
MCVVESLAGVPDGLVQGVQRHPGDNAWS